MEDWPGGSDEPRAWGRSLDTSCSWKCKGSTSTLQRIISRHTMLWAFKSLCVSVAKDADPFAHPLVLQHPACNLLPSLPHPFARWATGCWACSPKAPDTGCFRGSGMQQRLGEPLGLARILEDGADVQLHLWQLYKEERRAPACAGLAPGESSRDGAFLQEHIS